jgi:hypothetical protein
MKERNRFASGQGSAILARLESDKSKPLITLVRLHEQPKLDAGGAPL